MGYEVFDRLCKEKGVTAYQVAKETGVSTATLSSWKVGRYTPKAEKIKKLADYFGVSPEYFHIGKEPKTININRSAVMGAIDQVLAATDADKKAISTILASVNASEPKSVRIPVLGRIAAGIPLEMIEDIVDWEEVDAETAKQGEIFALQIKGNSMEPRIVDGDVVILHRQEDAESGDIVIATVNGNEATCKRLRKYKDGIELIPNNPAYAPMFFTNQEIINKPVNIIGKVIELRGKF